MTDNTGRERRAKALGLFSGGLDSMLAALVLARAGVEVVLITFETPFFSAERARRSAAHIGLPLRVLPVGPAHLELVKAPPRGYGSNMNPCVDCHAFMFARAGEIMEREGFDFLFSGEVLGQRPLSQNKQALGTVAKASGFGDRILRPLSALALSPTAMEESGLVDREKLLELTGRTRKPQMALAAELGVTDYPAPAGGCLLTEPGFSNRLRDLFAHDPAADVAKVELLKVGRHLRLSPAAKLVVGRNQSENARLEELAPAGALLMRAADLPGPLGVYFGPGQGEDLDLAAALVAGYGKAGAGQEVDVMVLGGPVLRVAAASKQRAAGLLL